MAQGLLRTPRLNFNADDIPGNAQQYVMVEIPNVGMVKVRKSTVAPGVQTYPTQEDMIKQIPTRDMPGNPGVEVPVKPPEINENKPAFDINSANPALILQNLQELPPIPEVPQIGGAESGAQPTMGGAQNMPTPRMDNQEMPPVKPAMPESGAGGVRGFVNSPLGMGLLSGLGEALIAKSQNKKDPMINAFLHGFEEQKKKSGFQDFATQINQANLNPQQKAFVQYAVNSGDPKLMETATKMLFPQTGTQGEFGAPIAVNDPATGKTKYVQVNKMGQVREVPGIKPINRYDTQFQKLEGNAIGQLARYNHISEDKGQEMLDAYMNGSLKLPDGTKLKPLTPSIYNSLSAYMGKTAPAATISKAQSANVAHAEIETLSDWVKPIYKTYGTTYLNRSPEALIDSFKSDPASQKRLGKLLAANVINNALVNAINRVDFGEAGEGAVHRLLEASHLTISTNFPRLSGAARAAAIEALQEAQSKAIETRNKFGVGALGAVGVPMMQNNEEDQQNIADSPAAAPQAAKPKATYSILNGQLVRN